MTTQKFYNQLQAVLSGDVWYGTPVYTIIENVNSDRAFSRTGNNHSIAHILLHMIAWTEETNGQLKGKQATDPWRGDWPEPEYYTWVELIGLFALANEHLQTTIVEMDENMLLEPINDPDTESGKGIERHLLIQGLIDHHIYHSAQIALLNKQLPST